MLEGQASCEYVAGHTSMIRREPIGVVGQITPWNYPLMMAIWKIGPALATGNTIVLKPAETTPISTVKLAELAVEFLPHGRAQRDHGHGKPAGSSLVTHPDIEMVSLTGSPEHRQVDRDGGVPTRSSACTSSWAARRRSSCSTTSTWRRRWRTIAATGLYNAGQDCTAATRVLASAKVYDDVVNGLAEQAKGYKVGDTFDPETTLGPLNSQRQRERVEGFLERTAVARRDRDRRQGARPARLLPRADGRREPRSRTTRWSRTRSSGRS